MSHLDHHRSPYIRFLMDGDLPISLELWERRSGPWPGAGDGRPMPGRPRRKRGWLRRLMITEPLRLYETLRASLRWQL